MVEGINAPQKGVLRRQGALRDLEKRVIAPPIDSLCMPFPPGHRASEGIIDIGGGISHAVRR